MREFRRVHRLADDAGRGDEDLVRIALGRALRMLHGHVDGLAALLAREGVGVTGVDDENARLALLQGLAAPEHRRGSGLGLGEHARGRGAEVHHGDEQIRSVLVADAGFGRGKAHAFDCSELHQLLGCEGGDGGGFAHDEL